MIVWASEWQGFYRPTYFADVIEALGAAHAAFEKIAEYTGHIFSIRPASRMAVRT